MFLRRKLPLSGLRALESYARTGRMTAAADELGVTYGAVSRAIKSLEHQLGLRLIEGATTRAALTPAGLRLSSVLTAAFDQIGYAVIREQSVTQPLRISCIGSFAARWLIPRLPSFRAAHPLVEVEIRESNDLVRFPARGYDAAIRMGEAFQPPGGVVREIMENHHGPVVSAGLWTTADGVLSSLPRLHTRSYLPAWSDWQRDVGLSWPVAVSDQEFDHIFFTLEAAVAGLGAAVAPWAYVSHEVNEGRLVAPMGFVRSRAKYVLITPADARGPALEAFSNWLMAQAAEMPMPVS